MSLIVVPAAEDDVLDAYTWYEDKSAGLGNRFLDSLDDAFQLILENPVAFPSVIDEVRRTVTRTFPYLVFFTHDDVAIYILAVIHAAQDPGYVASRLNA